MNNGEYIKVLEDDLDHSKEIIEKFIRSCSHELRSPVTSIEGLVRIAGYYSSHGEVKQCLELIHSCVDNMKEIIFRLQEYTIQLQREIRPEEISASQLVEKIVKEFSHEIEAERIEVIVDVQQAFVWKSDLQHHYSILRNLVSNAIRFSDPGKGYKRVNIWMNVDQTKIDLEVSDNGMGIHESERAKIFLPFHKGCSQSKGNGLGLFIVRGLARKLDAKLFLLTKKEVGTTLKLSIPNIK